MNQNDSILIIDDEIHIRRLLEITLNSSGYKTIPVSNGREGLASAATNYPSELARNHGRVLTHNFLLKEVWGLGYIEQTRYLRVFVAQLRKKIDDNAAKPELLLTESGIGYRFGG